MEGGTCKGTWNSVKQDTVQGVRVEQRKWGIKEEIEWKQAQLQVVSRSKQLALVWVELSDWLDIRVGTKAWRAKCQRKYWKYWTSTSRSAQERVRIDDGQSFAWVG